MNVARPTSRRSRARRRLRDGSTHLLVGRDPRDPRLLLRVLRDPEREQGGRRARVPQRRSTSSAGSAWLGIYHEETLQDWALHFKPLIIAANYFYGSLHFVVTIAAGIYLFRKFSDDYPRYRNTLAIATLLALIGFKLFPLMPPRLLPESYGFVDTLAKYPTFWSFNSGRGEQDLEPVRGDAERARLLGDVVRARVRATRQASLGQGARDRRIRSSPSS